LQWGVPILLNYLNITIILVYLIRVHLHIEGGRLAPQPLLKIKIGEIKFYGVSTSTAFK